MALSVGLPDCRSGRVAGLVFCLLPRGTGSPELVATILGTLSLGAACALVDLRWPRARVEDVIDQLQAKLLVDAGGESLWPVEFRHGTFARFTATTVMPQAAPVPWDAYSLELWSVLLSGGTSVVVDEPYISPSLLRAIVTDEGVNTVFLTSGLFNRTPPSRYSTRLPGCCD
jgi:mycobactin peptide synthetase MbtE